MSNIAVISLAGSQYVVKPGDKFEVNKLSTEVGKTFAPEVLLSTDGETVLFNEGKIEAKLVEQKRGEKIYVVKFKAKSRYRRRTGHRQYVSVVEVVSVNGEKAGKAKDAKVAKAEVVEAKAEKPAKKATVKKSTKAKTAKKSEK